jgi:hypothetical protein
MRRGDAVVRESATSRSTSVGRTQRGNVVACGVRSSLTGNHRRWWHAELPCRGAPTLAGAWVGGARADSCTLPLDPGRGRENEAPGRQILAGEATGVGEWEEILAGEATGVGEWEGVR